MKQKNSKNQELIVNLITLAIIVSRCFYKYLENNPYDWN